MASPHTHHDPTELVYTSPPHPPDLMDEKIEAERGSVDLRTRSEESGGRQAEPKLLTAPLGPVSPSLLAPAQCLSKSREMPLKAIYLPGSKAHQRGAPSRLWGQTEAEELPQTGGERGCRTSTITAIWNHLEPSGMSP